MSARERWIVYPLLFLTLGITVRDKIVRPSHLRASEVVAEQIHCERLRVDQPMDRLAVQGIQCGELLVRGPNGRPSVIIGTDANRGGVVQTFSASGIPLVALQPTKVGGIVVASEFVKSIPLPSTSRGSPSTPAPKSPKLDKAPVKPGK